MNKKFLGSRSTCLASLSILLIALLAAACSPRSNAGQPSQGNQPSTGATLPAGQQNPATLPTNSADIPTVGATQGSSQGSSGGGKVDPCKLVTTKEVTGLLGSSPAPSPRPGSPGDAACDFSVDNGLLAIDAANNPGAAIEFQMATSQFNNMQGGKTAQSKGMSMAVAGGSNVDGSGTPGFTGFLNKGDILVTLKLFSKTYSYNADAAIALLQAIGGRLP